MEYTKGKGQPFIGILQLQQCDPLGRWKYQ